MVGLGVAQSLENLMLRMPGWRRQPKAPPAPCARSPATLATLIEGEIIPRLLVANRAAAAPAEPAVAPEIAIGADQASAFAPMVLERDAFGLLQHIEGLIAKGAPVESVLVDLVAPAARQLGVYWEEDRCDFVDVTMGLWRLQELVHELAARIAPPERVPGADRRALFAALPGEQHSFGLAMVEEFFRSAGWITAQSQGAQEVLEAAVRRQWFDVVGLTVACEDHLDQASALIGALRTHSRNPRVGIMLGGRLITERPELAFLAGADATAPDARKAVARAELFIEALAGRQISHC